MSQESTPVDPLARPTGETPMEALAEAKKDPTQQYLRGFFSAEQRRPIVDHEPGLGGMIFAGMFSAFPFVFMYWLAMRSRVQASQVVKNSQEKAGVMAGFKDMMEKMQNPMGNRDFRVTVKTTKFKDVIAVPEAKDEIKQYVDFLQDPARFTRLGARLPKGCLLTGDPGTGKTLLAKAVAGEADVPFFTCSGADFIEVYAGSGPKRVRDLFKEAKKEAPSVIFIDEIDAVGSRSSGNSNGSVAGEENRTVNQLLAEMDGLTGSEAIVVFAATNFQDNIDKALLREGRFDRKVEIPMPDKPAREELFTHYLNKVITGDPHGLLVPPSTPITNVKPDGTVEVTTPPPEGGVEPDPNVSNASMAESLAGLTPGISPATIATVINEAALAAAVAGDKRVSMKQLLPAIDDVIIGKKHRSRMSVDATRRVALHEAGHTVTAWLLSQQSDVIKVSVTPRGNAGGFTQQLGRERLDMATDAIIFTDICVMLGGRAGEALQYNNLTTGAYDDLQRATQTAMNKFLAFGMSKEVGLLAFEYQRIDQGRLYQKHSERLSEVAEREGKALIDSAFVFTTNLLRENRAKVEAVADLLVEQKEVLKEDLERILGPRPGKGPLHPEAAHAMERFVKLATSEQVRASTKGPSSADKKQAKVAQKKKTKLKMESA